MDLEEPEWEAMDWKRVTAELQKPLDSRHVKPPPKGKYGEYIEGWHAIAEANAIFGFAGWDYHIDRLEVTAPAVTVEKTDNRGEVYEQWEVSYLAVVTVRVDTVVRQDVGHGSGHSRAQGDAHDSAVKEAVTDGLKRALRTFGSRFGLALYDKTKANVIDAWAAKTIEEIEAAQTLEGLHEIWSRVWHKYSKNPPALLVAAKDARKAGLERGAEPEFYDPKQAAGYEAQKPATEGAA